MGSGEVAIVALSTMISLKVTFSDGLGGVSVFVKVLPYTNRKTLHDKLQFTHISLHYPSLSF